MGHLDGGHQSRGHHRAPSPGSWEVPDQAVSTMCRTYVDEYGAAVSTATMFRLIPIPRYY